MGSIQTLLQTQSQQGRMIQRKHPKLRMYSEEEWESLRPEITRLHKTNTAKSVRCILENTHSVSVTTSMVKKRFKKWNLRKNSTKGSKEITLDSDLGLEHLEAAGTNQGLGYANFKIPQEIVQDTNLVKNSTGFIFPRVDENNNPRASERIIGPQGFSNEPNSDWLQDQGHGSGENFFQPIADHLDLVYGDFTRSDNMDELAVENEYSVFMPPSCNKSVDEQKVNLPGNGILIDSWDQWNDDTDLWL